MFGNYFFIDGSALTAQIRSLWRLKPDFAGRKLCIIKFTSHFVDAFPDLHAHNYKRVTFYFPHGDEVAIERFLLVPDHKIPGAVRDVHINFCGEKLKKSAEIDKWFEENVPPKYADRFNKSEKGVDIQICCDALKLASAGKVDRLFLLTNDSDFIPFFRTIKEFGSNISVFHLFDTGKPNLDLLREADSFDVIPDDQLDGVFELPVDVPEQPEPPTGDGSKSGTKGFDLPEPQPEKRHAEPSDLNLAEGSETSDERGAS